MELDFDYLSQDFMHATEWMLALREPLSKRKSNTLFKTNAFFLQSYFRRGAQSEMLGLAQNTTMSLQNRIALASHFAGERTGNEDFFAVLIERYGNQWNVPFASWEDEYYQVPSLSDLFVMGQKVGQIEILHTTNHSIYPEQGHQINVRMSFGGENQYTYKPNAPVFMRAKYPKSNSFGALLSGRNCVFYPFRNMIYINNLLNWVTIDSLLHEDAHSRQEVPTNYQAVKIKFQLLSDICSQNSFSGLEDEISQNARIYGKQILAPFNSQEAAVILWQEYDVYRQVCHLYDNIAYFNNLSHDVFDGLKQIHGISLIEYVARLRRLCGKSIYSVNQ